MNLLLWRHADAVDGQPDLSRVLSPKGRQQAAEVGQWIRRNLSPEAEIVVSPARRTRQTADALGLPYRIDDALAPGAEVSSILSVALPAAEPAPRDRLLVGHQPWIGETAAMLMTGAPTPWSVRKAALWWLVRRQRLGTTQWTLRAIIDPEL